MSLEKLSHQLAEFYDKMASWEHSIVKDSGLSPAQMHTVEIIGHNQNMRMKELDERLGVTTGSLTVGVDKLEKLGNVLGLQLITPTRYLHVGSGHLLYVVHAIVITENLLANGQPKLFGGQF